jgi:hypothetical protein
MRLNNTSYAVMGAGEASLPRKLLRAAAAAALLPLHEKGFLEGLQPSKPPCRSVTA